MPLFEQKGIRPKIDPTAFVAPPRFTDIWPFASLDVRAAARSESVARGVWPPKVGPDWLTGEMRSIVALPTAISPLA
ncbi:NIPSNAP family protein [Bradyrhizobium liaoningense]|uniref:NIPSNAP family protein n=1 Tax=Bradyrhizobium liaoningense TaxID=43992 RepID=UPI00289DFC8B|nr:NIPSNAP family protein [Bradyrhizobium liaoningense]